jgi:hypothetical protein
MLGAQCAAASSAAIKLFNRSALGWLTPESQSWMDRGWSGSPPSRAEQTHRRHLRLRYQCAVTPIARGRATSRERVPGQGAAGLYVRRSQAEAPQEQVQADGEQALVAAPKRSCKCRSAATGPKRAENEQKTIPRWGWRIDGLAPNLVDGIAPTARGAPDQKQRSNRACSRLFCVGPIWC